MASRSWNRVELIGNLTRDPELRYTPNGAAVCTFGVATNRTYVTEGERKEEVDFHRLVAWNKLAELCNQLLKKGNRVFISGRLQTRSWEAQDGTTRTVTEIVIEDMILLSPKLNVGENLAVPEDVNVELAKAREAESQMSHKESKAEEKETAEVSKVFEKPAEEPKTPKEEAKKETTPAPQEEVKDDLPF